MVDVPEHLLQRSRERRKALGLPVPGEEDEGGTEATPEDSGGEVPAEPEGPEAPAEQPTPAPAEQPASAAQPAAGGGAGHFDELSKKSGVPAHLLERSAKRRSQLTGEEMPAGDGGTAPAPAAQPAAAGAGAPAAAAATATAPAPTAAGPAGHTHRLLTVVKAGSIQQTKATPVDKVHTWPHLLVFEFTALLAMSAVLIVFSALVRAPLLELADPNLTPNPSKAPWYFLGLQELLTMFHPMVAGVLIPGYGLVALGAAPYVDKNPSNDPSSRKFAVSLFTVFIVAAALLAIIGSFFRGPGFNFTFPWSDGIFFDL